MKPSQTRALRVCDPSGVVMDHSARRKTHTGNVVVALLLAASVSSAATFTVTNNANSGPGSLRTAIASAGAPGADTVAFAIVGSTVITLTSDIVSSFVNGVTIDGSTQTGIKIILPAPGSGSQGLAFLSSTDIVIQDLEITRINSAGNNQSILIATAPFSSVRPARVAIKRATVSGSESQIVVTSAIDTEVSDCVINDGTALSLTGTLAGFHAFGNRINVSAGLFVQAGGSLTVTSSIPVGPSNYVVFEPGNGIETTTLAINSFNNNSVTVRDIDLSYAGPLPGRVGTGIAGLGSNWVVDNVRVTNRVLGVSLFGHNGQVTNSDLSNNDKALLYQETFPPGVNLRVSGNVFTGSGIGVELRGVSNGLVTNAVPTNSTNYVVLDAASDIATVQNPLVASGSSLYVENIDFSGAPGVGGTAINYDGNLGGTITGCTLSDRGRGVLIRNDQATNTLSCNRIEGNSSAGFQSQDGNNLFFSTILVDNYISGNTVGVSGGNRAPGRTVALNNYWGAANGPSNLGGSGDSYFGTVDANPFSITAPSCINEAPIAICQDFAVLADATACTATVNLSDVDGGSFDPSGPLDIDTLCISAIDGVPIACVDPVTVSGLGSHTVTLTITDVFGESDSCLATVTVSDATGPQITGVPADTTVECSAIPVAARPTMTDNCDTTPSLAFGEVIAGDNCSGTVTRTWTATDDSGNATVEVQVLQLQDSTPPTWISALPGPTTIACSTALPAPPTLAASDNCDTSVAVSLVTGPLVGTECNGTITRTWTATDDCGNDITHVQIITVRDDVDPLIDGVPDDTTVECDSIPDPVQPTTSDNCDTSPTLDYAQDRTDGNCEDNYTLTRTWTATDACNNVTVGTQVVTVQDTTDPVVTGVLEPVAALPAQSANSAASVCSAPISRLFKVVCEVDDNCDDMPHLSAKLVSTQNEVSSGGQCNAVVSDVVVDCDQVVEIELLAAPCAADGPTSARPAASVNSSGALVVVGESVVLEVKGEDRCGNVATDVYDPATEPSTLCDEVLLDGTCCPAVGQPTSDCEQPCGGAGFTGVPTQQAVEEQSSTADRR